MKNEKIDARKIDTKASEWYKKACQKGNSHGCENYKKLHN